MDFRLGLSIQDIVLHIRHMARGRAGGTRPPPPCPRLRAKEADRRPNTAPPSAPVDSRTGACRKQRPPPASLVHARTIRTRDKPPPPPLPFARKGGETQERGAARDRARDAGRRGGTRAHRPFPPLTGDRARNARGGAAAPLPWFVRRGDTQTRGARGDESGCAPHTLSAPPPFARTGGALQPGAAPPSPRVGARGQRAEAVPPPLCIRHKGKRTGGALGPRAPPFPGSRARANANGRRRGNLPSPAGSRATANANGQPRGSAPIPRVRAPGRNATRGAPLPCMCPGNARARWRVTGRRADREARPGAPALRFAHKGGTHTRAALVRKAERARG
ncbi:hypothetical protein EDB85DRAFT_2289215 [Lactarius pseudohatsudake]|nr:hypothetical protein EDB85DRAFT_2289215 [Lactarius pseudohatsudake]